MYMSDTNNQNKVEFEGEPTMLYSRLEPNNETPMLVMWAIKFSGGLIKNEKQAVYILLGFVALSIIIFLITVFGGGPEIPLSPPTPFQEGNL